MKFNKKLASEILKRETEFITNLLDILPLPKYLPETDSSDVLLNGDNHGTQKRQQPTIVGDRKPRAKSLVELKQRLQASKKGESKITFKEKLERKALKKQKFKKNKLLRRREIQKNKPSKGQPEAKVEVESEDAKPKPKVVFSKIDFPNDVTFTKKPKQDPKQALKQLKKKKEKLDRLREGGNVKKVVEIKNKVVFEAALAKSRGEKVQDDPELLEKTIKRKQQQVKRSEKKWKSRNDIVQKAKDERQSKRQENIDIRKKAKKTNKLKKAAKRGRIIPGF